MRSSRCDRSDLSNRRADRRDQVVFDAVPLVCRPNNHWLSQQPPVQVSIRPRSVLRNLRLVLRVQVVQLWVRDSLPTRT